MLIYDQYFANGAWVKTLFVYQGKKGHVLYDEWDISATQVGRVFVFEPLDGSPQIKMGSENEAKRVEA